MIKRADRILIIVTAVILLLSLFIISPLSNLPVSLIVMSVYSADCAKEGIPAKKNIDLKIPGGGIFQKDGWYPLMLTFVPGNGFGDAVGRDCSLTILYDFPAYDFSKGCSRLYDEKDPLYSSFYGAYLVECRDGIYGFEENGGQLTINFEEVAAVARYDYQNLVLADFGLDPGKAVFSYEIDEIKEDVSYVGSNGWTAVDARLFANGCAHKKNGLVVSYMQYGIPAFETDEPLAPAELYGRIYGKYLPEKEVSIFFYIITADRSELEKCDASLLSKSTLSY